MGAPQGAIGWSVASLFPGRPGYVPPILRGPLGLHNGGRRCWHYAPFCRRLGKSSGYLGPKWRPPPGDTRRGPVNSCSAGDLRRYCLKKNWAFWHRQDKQRGQACLYARLCAPGAGQTASLVLAGVIIDRDKPYIQKNHVCAILDELLYVC